MSIKRRLKTAEELARKIELHLKLDEGSPGFLLNRADFERVVVALRLPPLESVAKSIEKLTLHGPLLGGKNADWLKGQEIGLKQGLKYAAATVRQLGDLAPTIDAVQHVSNLHEGASHDPQLLRP